VNTLNFKWVMHAAMFSSLVLRSLFAKKSHGFTRMPSSTWISRHLIRHSTKLILVEGTLKLLV